MRKPVAFFVFGVCLLLLQVSLLPHLFPLVPRPNLVLTILVYLAAGTDSLLALSWTACMGFVFDVLSGGPFGLFSFEFVALHIIIRGARRVLVLRHPAFLAGTVLLAHLLQILFFASILATLGLPLPADLHRADQILPGPLVAALMSLPLFVLLERIDRPPAITQLN